MADYPLTLLKVMFFAPEFVEVGIQFVNSTWETCLQKDIQMCSKFGKNDPIAEYIISMACYDSTHPKGPVVSEDQN